MVTKLSRVGIYKIHLEEISTFLLILLTSYIDFLLILVECSRYLSKDSLGRPSCFGARSTWFHVCCLLTPLVHVLPIHGVAESVVGMTHVHDLAFGHVELHPPLARPRIRYKFVKNKAG
jgi:hypothetical protein